MENFRSVSPFSAWCTEIGKPSSSTATSLHVRFGFLFNIHTLSLSLCLCVRVCSMDTAWIAHAHWCMRVYLYSFACACVRFTKPLTNWKCLCVYVLDLFIDTTHSIRAKHTYHNNIKVREQQTDELTTTRAKREKKMWKSGCQMGEEEEGNTIMYCLTVCMLFLLLLLFTHSLPLSRLALLLFFIF